LVVQLKVNDVALAVFIFAAKGRISLSSSPKQLCAEELGINGRQSQPRSEYTCFVPPACMRAAEAIVTELGDVDDRAFTVRELHLYTGLAHSLRVRVWPAIRNFLSIRGNHGDRIP